MSVVLTTSDDADGAPEGLEWQPALLNRHQNSEIRTATVDNKKL